MIKALILCLMLAGTVNAQFVNVPPFRGNTVGGFLGDIDSHLRAGHIYKDRDRVTWAHETTHGINARIRNEFKVANGYYLLDNRGFTLAKSEITLRRLANAVPPSERGPRYSLYLVQQQRWWNDDALYIVDELVAYTNGAIVGKQLGMTQRYKDSRASGQDLLKYVKILSTLTKEINYKDQKNLEMLIRGIERVLDMDCGNVMIIIPMSTMWVWCNK